MQLHEPTTLVSQKLSDVYTWLTEDTDFFQDQGQRIKLSASGVRMENSNVNVFREKKVV